MPNLNGLSFPLRIGPRGSFITTSSINKIKDNLKAIILTKYGERFMSPTFGSLGYLYLFKNLNPQTIEAVKATLIRGIEASDKRITVVSLELIPPNEQGVLEISLKFRLSNYTEYQDLSVFIQE